MARQRRIAPLVVSLLIILASLACAPGNPGDIPSPPGGQIPVSQEAADRLKENFNREMQEASTGEEFRLFVTNEEITALVALTLQDTGSIPLSEPQVWFTAGRVYMTGTFSPFWPLRFQSLIVATAVVNDDQIEVEVERAQMGPFPFPRRVLASASESINETLAEMQLDLKITALEILEGELQLAGTRRDLQ
ncbi:MAG: hypothetical protein Kow0063_03480 [Anaerolineae bacterium]